MYHHFYGLRRTTNLIWERNFDKKRDKELFLPFKKELEEGEKYRED